MERVSVFFDREGNTLTIWFGDPEQEYICDEAADDVILMKDQTGRVIGLEKLNFSRPGPDPVRIVFETIGEGPLNRGSRE